MKSQSQNLIPIVKVSVSLSKIETGYIKSQSQHAKTGFAQPWEKIEKDKMWCMEMTNFGVRGKNQQGQHKMWCPR